MSTTKISNLTNFRQMCAIVFTAVQEDFIIIIQTMNNLDENRFNKTQRLTVIYQREGKLTIVQYNSEYIQFFDLAITLLIQRFLGGRIMILFFRIIKLHSLKSIYDIVASWSSNEIKKSLSRNNFKYNIKQTPDGTVHDEML